MLPVYQRVPQARLRRTREGGAAFLPETATTVELDAEGFTVVALLAAPLTARDLRRHLITGFARNFTIAEVDILVRELAERGFVALVACDPSPAPSLLPAPSDPAAGPLPPPESVHLQLNNVCNLRCPSCYVGLQKEDVGSISLERLGTLIDEWAAMGVFQLALGGGEPLLSPKFAPVACYARQCGIVPNVTTNGWLISAAMLREVEGSIGEIRMSLNDAVSADRSLLSERAALMRAHGVRFGFNLIVTRSNVDLLPDLFRWAREHEAATINLIRPKPAPGNASWYAKNALRPADALRLRTRLCELEGVCQALTVTVDCALAFLFQGRTTEELQSLGIVGCPMGDRFATIKWNGDVYPCSHLHGEEFRAGSILTESFRAIWERSHLFQRIRRELARVEGHCGDCGHNPFCKGCRAVMQARTGHWLAADDECAFAPTATAATKQPERTSALLLPMLETQG
jgi:radical SAM protein with 4Fe4S-binding SPASM domain